MGLFDLLRGNKELDGYMAAWRMNAWQFASEDEATASARASRLTREELRALKLSLMLLQQRDPGAVAYRKLFTLHSQLGSGEVLAIGKSGRYGAELELGAPQAAAAELLHRALSEAYATLAAASGSAQVSPLASVEDLVAGCRDFENALYHAGATIPTE